MALDLFAGAGGASVGLHLLGLDVVGVDHDADACATHAAAGWPTIRADLTGPLPIRYSPDFVWASPPCTAFSMAGKGAGRDVSDELAGRILAEDWTPMHGMDPSVWLVLPTMQNVLALGPTVMAWENVPPTLPVMRSCALVLERHGWHTAAGVLSAEAFGVAQTRKRAFLIANRDRPVALPEPTHQSFGTEEDGAQGLLFGESRAPWVSMADALGWSPTEKMGHEPPTWQHPTSMDRRQQQGEPGQREAVPPVPVTRPAPTMTAAAGARGVYTWAYGPRQDAPGSVRITVAEAARLQAFAASHPWQGSRTSQFRQIGNAVPPPVAAAVAGAALGLDWQPAVAGYLADLYAAPVTTSDAA